jgi:hypothetical protein
MSIQRKFLVICILLSSLGAFAQNKRMEQSFGLAGSTTKVSGKARAVTDSTVLDSDFRLTLRQYGIYYSARVDLLQWSLGSISIGGSATGGVSTTSNYRSEDFNGTKMDTVEGVKGLNFAFDIPVFADLNIGLHSAAAEANQKIGIYLGAGYGYNYTRIKTSAGRVTYDGFDPILRAGIRMGSRWDTRWSIGFMVRGSLQANSGRTYGLNLLKEL